VRSIFADTFYWIALANPRDEWREAARRASTSFASAMIYTTDEVLAEFLTFFSSMGPQLRKRAILLVEHVLESPDVHVIPQTRDSFLAGVQLYKGRPDKAYSLVDCICMQAMKEEGIAEALTGDQHFAQEGFVVLLCDDLRGAAE